MVVVFSERVKARGRGLALLEGAMRGRGDGAESKS